MAIELARDANAIARDDRNLKIWFDRENNPESYRKRFKFDRLSSSACLAFDLYKFCSKFGVHGHMTTNIHAKPTGETFANGAGIMINTDETAIFSGLEIWLRSFFPIHALYIDALKKDILDVEPFKMFADFIQNLDPILEAIGKKARGTDIEH